MAAAPGDRGGLPADIGSGPSPRRAPDPRVRWLIGIDGGGTGTRARLTDREGRVLGEGEAGPSALGQGLAPAWSAIEGAIAAAWAEAALPGPPAAGASALGIGVSGAAHAPWREALQARAAGHAVVAVDSDIRTRLLGAFGAAPGGVLSAGTGSFAACQDADGRVTRSGGWGFPVGDEGSGAWIGLRAVRHAQAVLDGREDAGPLALAVLGAIRHDRAAGGPAGAASPAVPEAGVPGSADPLADRPATAAQVRRWCAQAGQAAYASLAPWVFEAAAADPAAERLLARAASALLALTRPLDRGDVARPWVVAGSIAQRLAPRWPAAFAARRVAPRGDACDGALTLARRAAGLDAEGLS